MLSPNNLRDKIDPKEFIQFHRDGIEIYIHQELIDKNEIEFTISSVGKFKIIFEDNTLKENNDGQY